MLFLIVAIATQLINMAVAWMATVTAWHTTNEIRIRLAKHVLGLSHAFHRQHTPGELIQRVDGDVTSVSDFMGRVIPRAAGALFMMVGMIGVLIVVDWRLAVGATIYVAAAVGVVVRGRHRAVGESSDEMGSYARLYGGIEERLTAAEDLRSNGAGGHAMWRFVEDSADALGSAVRREKAFLRMWWGVDGSVAAGSIVSLVVSAMLVSRNIITIGDAFLLFQYVLLLARPLEDMVDQLETVQKANGAMVRVIDLLAVEPDIRDDGTTLPPSGPLSIEFDDVTYDYGDDQIVLQSINLNFAAGRSVGIVGRTGSGKTTLSRLVLRLVEATGGTLRLGGVADRRDPVRRAAPACRADPAGGRTAQRHGARQRHAVRRDAVRRGRRDGAAQRRPRRPRRRWHPPRSSEPAAPVCRRARHSCWRSPGSGCATPTSSCSTRRRLGSTRSPRRCWKQRSPG